MHPILNPLTPRVPILVVTFWASPYWILRIGAGGGSIAWLDHGGLTCGATKRWRLTGPACYSLGENAPTVTDANLVLRYLNLHNILGGKMQISRDKAEEVIRTFG